MNIGVVHDQANQEHRVPLTPAGVQTLVDNGHAVFVESGAGDDSHFPNQMYQDVGGTVVFSRAEVFNRAELLVKISPLTVKDCDLLTSRQIVFSFHHLPIAPESVIDTLIKKNVTAIGYEIIEDNHGNLPILTSMSEIAGQLSAHIGGHYLQNEQGGRGILLGGIPGVPQAAVVILGAGVVGLNATQTILGLGGQVVLLDHDTRKLRRAIDLFGKRITTATVNDRNLEKGVKFADILIGAVLIRGDRAPHLISVDHVRSMKHNAVIIDVSIDQGGCVETSRPTTLADPVFVEEGVIHYCVPNMTSNVSRTATYALTNTCLPYVQAIADSGLKRALELNAGLRNGVYFFKGTCTVQKVAQFFDIPFRTINNPFLRT